MSENGPAAMDAPASRAASVVVTVLAGFVGLAGLALVLGLRIANAGQELAGQSLWIVAWLAVGIVDVVAGAALVTRFGNRRLAVCLVVVGAAAVLVAVAIQSQSYAASIAGTTSSWDLLGGADVWARPLAMGVLAALVPLELASRRRRHSQILWWSALAVVAATAVGAAAGAHVPGVDIVDVTTWLVAAAAATASGLLVVGWWRSRGVDDDPLQGWLAAGSVVAWLVVVPSLEIAGREIPAHDVVVPLLLLSTLPLLIVGLLVRVLRERPGRFHGVAHEVIAWLALAAAIAVVYTGVVAGIGRLVGDSGSTWLLVATTVVIAVCIEPARHRVRIAVDRLVWGVRDDPLAVVRSIVDHLGADPGDELLPSLAESLKGDLHFDSVAIDVLTPQGWRREGGSSASTTYQRVVELEHDGEVVGRLVVGWEYGPSLRARDERMLAELAGALAPGPRLGPAGQRPASLQRRRRHDAGGGAPAPASRPPRRARAVPDRRVARRPHRAAPAGADDRHRGVRAGSPAPRPRRRRGRRHRHGGEADRPRPAAHRARPARPRGCRRRVHPDVRRRPRIRPHLAGRARRAARRRRGGHLPDRHRGRHQRRAPRPRARGAG